MESIISTDYIKGKKFDGFKKFIRDGETGYQKNGKGEGH